MNRSHRALLIVVATALSTACKGNYNPAGTYAGALMETSQVMAGPAGAGTANVSNMNRPTPNAHITVESVGATQVRVHFTPTCTVLYELASAPNEQNATVALNPPQSCTVDVTGYRGTVAVSGTALFARGNEGVTQLTATGSINSAGAAGTWTVTFDGTTPTH